MLLINVLLVSILVIIITMLFVQLYITEDKRTEIYEAIDNHNMNKIETKFENKPKFLKFLYVFFVYYL